MPDIWMDVDAALSEVPVNIMPLIDDTDFKTREVAVAYNAAGMDLVWNFVNTAGAFTQIAVTPTTGGNYDWAHQGDGIYTIEIPASGGASINNDTEGFGWFSGICTGVLPWRGPIIGFRAAGLNDLMIDAAYSTTRGLVGTALPDAVAGAANGLQICGSNAAATYASLTVTNALTSGSNAIPWNAAWDAEVQSECDDAINANAVILDIPTTAEFNARTIASASYGTAANQSSIIGYIDTEVTAILAAVDTEVAAIKTKTDNLPAAPAATGDIPSAASIADAVWDEASTGHTDAGKAGAQLWTDIDAILEDTGTTLDALIKDVPTVAEFEARTSATPATAGNQTTIIGYLDTEIAAILAAVDTEVAAIKTKTDFLPSATAGSAGGLFIAGANAATSITTALTANITGSVSGSIGSLAAQAKADVHAEVLDVLNTDTFAEPGQESPPATTSLVKKIGYLYKAWRNKLTNNGTQISLYNDAGDTVDQKASVSEVDGTVTRGEFGTGP